MTKKRDNFSLGTRQRLADRAGNVCSNPFCRLPTSGAALGDGEKASNVGVAAHITAAAPGGPRYDPQLTPEERVHISNGIWLCNVHAKQIDDGLNEFTVEKLRAWKQAADARAQRLILHRLAAPRGADAGSEGLKPGFGLAQRLGLPAEDDLPAVTARILDEANLDLAAFRASLKTTSYDIPLDLRLTIDDETDDTAFEPDRIAAALPIYNELTLIAPPGTGKTTTLLRVARSAILSGTMVAVFLPLSEWSSQQATLLQSIVQRKAFAGESEEHFKFLAANGRLALMLDGWNELDQAGRRRLRAEITALRRDYPDLGLVMSTRRQALDVPLEGSLVEIQPLSEPQQLKLATAIGGSDGERLLDEARRTPGIRDLIAIPLYLTTLLRQSPGGHLPTTKEAVLRAFVSQQPRDAGQAEALTAAALGLQTIVLEEIAAAATRADSLHIGEDVARRIVKDVMDRQAADGQISSAQIPHPGDVLDALVDRHLLIRTGESSVLAFQHQQFQEWFASFEVERLARASAVGDARARELLRTGVLNVYGWEEAVLFACERASTGDAHATAGATHLIREALSIDPMLAADATNRTSDAVWQELKLEIVAFADAWHRKGQVDRAVRFMIKTGRSEFAPALWELIENPDQQAHLAALRAGDRFHISVLGVRPEERILHLPHRDHVLWELIRYGGPEGIALAAEIALESADAALKSTVAQALIFRRASYHLQRLLADAPREVWNDLAQKWYPGEVDVPDIEERLHVLNAIYVDSLTDPVARLRALLRQARYGSDVGADIGQLLASASFDKASSRPAAGDDAYEAGQLYPRTVSEALIQRLEAGLPFPRYVDALVEESGVVIDGGAIPERVLRAETEDHLAELAAALIGPKTVGAILDEISPAIARAEPLADNERRKHDRMTRLIARAPIASMAIAVLERSETTSAKVIALLASVVARHGKPDEQKPIALTPPLRQGLIEAVSRWGDTLLGDASIPRHRVNELVPAIGRLAAPELEKLLERMLDRDLERRRQQLRDLAALRAQGKHDPSSEAHSSYTNWYASAFVAIGGEQVAATMIFYLPELGHDGFGEEAASVLRRMWDRAHEAAPAAPFVMRQSFASVKEKRRRRQAGPAPVPSPYGDAILRVVDELLTGTASPESQLHALKLAPIGFSMPYGDKHELIARLIELPQPYGAKLGLLNALARAGEVLSAEIILQGIRDLVADAQQRTYLLSENEGRAHYWLALLALSDRPGALLDALALLPAAAQTPWRLRNVLEALGDSPSEGVEETLTALAERDARFYEDNDWYVALEKRGTLSSAKTLLGAVTAGKVRSPGGRLHAHDFGRKLAAALRRHPAIRPEIYRALGAADLPDLAGAIIEDAIAQVPDEEGVKLLLQVRAVTGRPFGRILSDAIQHSIIEQRPSENVQGAFEMISQPAVDLRKHLFARATLASGHEAKLAAACLAHIDELRDRYGIADEPRHPDIERDTPWPLVR